ncbi:efflux RND transporter periplasmic adaptor subunit [Acetobacteraceae bacterium H6797]|nr:efflux RND transporter periplasmic adaptor subunit [Acetobacteraceae bacterium H6797]
MKKAVFLVLGLALLAVGAWRWQMGQWPTPAAVTAWWNGDAGAAQQRTGAGPNASGGGQRGARGGGPSATPLPVTTAVAERKDVPVILDALGTVQAYATVTVRAQVSGTLLEVPFKEGQEVKKGDVLARIDARTYQAALDQAKASKAQLEAQLANARLDLRRYVALARADGVTQQQADTQRATVAQLEAQVQAAQAQIDSAQTQLDYTTIRSPIDGRVGLRQVDAGNLVSSGDTTGLVTITQLRPIAITFTLPQQELPRVLTALQAGTVPVDALVRGEHGQVAKGTVETVDNLVDSTTGTIKLKARFENTSSQLWPGAFVNVRVQVEVLKQVLVIPLVAVQRGPNGAFAFVVQPDMTVRQAPLTLGTLTADSAVVQGGLNPGDRVVSSGALRLFDGSRVALAEGEAPVTGGVTGGTRPARPAGMGQGSGVPGAGDGQRVRGDRRGENGEGGFRRPPSGSQPSGEGGQPPSRSPAP